MVVNGTGTANVDITNVQITCPQPTLTIGGQLIGLVPGPGDTVELQNNAGDNLFLTGDNQTFTFPTQVTSGGIYNVSVFLEPTSQPQPCNVFNGSGVSTANVTNVLIDCQHNDWAWIFGPTSVNQYTQVHSVAPPIFPNTNNPGGRDFGITWTDNAGRKWIFGGFGYPANNTLNQPAAFLNDMWVWDTVDGADVNFEIGGITEVAAGRPDCPALLFDGIKGFARGFRIFTNATTNPQRAALALGIDPTLRPLDALKAWMEKRKTLQPRPPAVVPDAAFLQNTMTGDDVDLAKFPAPVWHRHDGGPFIGSGSIVIMRAEFGSVLA